jgi:putative flippase GtrA
VVVDAAGCSCWADELTGLFEMFGVRWRLQAVYVYCGRPGKSDLRFSACAHPHPQFSAIALLTMVNCLDLSVLQCSESFELALMPSRIALAEEARSDQTSVWAAHPKFPGHGKKINYVFTSRFASIWMVPDRWRSLFHCRFGNIRAAIDGGHGGSLGIPVSFAIGAVVNYFLSTQLAFRAGRFHPSIEIGSFLTVVVVGLGLTTASMYALTSWLHLSGVLAKVITVPIVLVWNFLGRRFFVFQPEMPARTAALSAR